jgi:ribonuclease-3
MTQAALQKLMQRLGYTFQEVASLRIALTHRSRGGEDNERLEFLGDAVISMVTAEILYQKFPKATEGDLSRFRSSLVNRDALADLALQFELGQYLLLGQGEMRSGGHERRSILSCAMEAVMGAIYLDGGFDAIKQCILVWYQTQLASLSNPAHHKDPKTLLQESLQSRRCSLPVYVVEATEGEAHRQSFTVSCYVADLDLKTFGQGLSRRKAEQSAAFAMLDLMRK